LAVVVECAHAEAQHETRFGEVDVLHLDGGRNNGHVSRFHLFGWKILWRKQEKSIETLKKKDAHGRTGMLGAIGLKDSTGAINLAW